MGSKRLGYIVVYCISLSELKICNMINSPGKVKTSIVTFLQSEYIRKVTKSTNKNLQIMVHILGTCNIFCYCCRGCSYVRFSIIINYNYFSSHNIKRVHTIVAVGHGCLYKLQSKHTSNSGFDQTFMLCSGYILFAAEQRVGNQISCVDLQREVNCP